MVATNTNANVPVITGSFYIGSSNGTFNLNGFVAKIAIWKGGRLNNLTLQQKTNLGTYLGN